LTTNLISLSATFSANDECETCEEILHELESIDDDTDKHGIQFVKTDDEKLAHDIGVFAFPALVYYETGVPIMYDGKLFENYQLIFLRKERSNNHTFLNISTLSLLRFLFFVTTTTI
jgi:hypothetical protein